MNKIFISKSICTAILLLPAIQSSIFASCTATGTGGTSHCGSDYINYLTDTGNSSLVVDGETTTSIEMRPADSTSGPFNQTLTIKNSTLNRVDYSGVISQTVIANRNITVNIDNNVSITAKGGSGGVWVKNDISGDVTVDNAATISYDGNGVDTNGVVAAAIDARTNNGNVTLSNSGRVTGINGSRGLYADGGFTNTSDVLVKIINTGNVTATAAAIRSINYKGLAQIQNNGTATSSNFQGLVVWSNDGPVTISNSGTVTSHKNIAIQGMTNTGDINITNSGTTNAPTDINITAAEGIKANVNTSGNINITNASNGIINSSVNYAVYADTQQGDINFNNQGGVTALNGGYFNTLNGSITINNEKTITSKNKAIVIDSGTSANITNKSTGVIESLLNGNLSKDAYVIDTNTNTVMTNYGTLKGNFKDSNNKLEVNNHGLIELSSDTNGVNSAKINNFVQGNDGKLKINLLSESSGITGYSQLQTKNATFNDGSTIDVNVLTTSTNQGLLIGKKLDNVISSSNSLIINGKLNITDNSALLSFRYEKDDNTIDLNIVKEQSISQASAPTQYTNAQGAAKAFDKIIDDNNHSDMNTYLNKLLMLSTNEAVAQAVESTTPTATNATIGATTQISNGVAGIVTQRQNANISGGLNSGDGIFIENNLWIKPFGSLGSQNNKDGINGFDLKTYGLGLGADTEYKDNQRFGVGLFYTNANVDINNMNQNTDLDVYTALIYGNIPIIDDKTNFLYQVGYSWQKTTTDRAIALIDKTAEGKYTSNTASLDLKLMRDVNINNDLLLQPLVSTTYRHLSSPEYEETGADALNLKVNKFTTTELIVGLGTLIHYKLDSDSKLIGNLNIGYDLHDKSSFVTSSYLGASGVNFTTDGIDNGRWSYEAGIGYEKDLNKSDNINISYNYQGEGRDFSNNVISAKYVVKF